MPHDISARTDVSARIDAWLARCADPKTDPLDGMAEAGLLAPADSYQTIAHVKAALGQRTGLPGVAGVWGGRQIVARWFIAGFGNDTQRAAWLARAAAVAISEPGVGAHPKLLTTRAEPDGDGFRINGEKAWVSNGPSADVFIVLAITAEQAGRKRYSALLVPHDAPGVALSEMPAFHALRPSRHCGLALKDVHVPEAALLGAEGTAYETMALPFRDIEDAVGMFTLLGCYRCLRAQLGGSETGEEAAASLGAISGLVAVFGEAAEAVVAALDAGRLPDQAAVLSGLQVLAADILQRLRAHQERFGPAGNASVAEVLRDLDVLLSVARGPRRARLVRLGR
ncbi:MAG TPA: acyl-CoA dehydrogenase family protein [Acetobacteraceae bacterium]|nr:acyl-CoA dehydrogenase family protein [Acetobacteraceae bacterium]